MILKLLIYSTISFLIFIFISKISYKLNLTDKPGKRKLHLKPTAYTGGLALSLTYVLAIYLFKFSSPDLDLIFSISFLVAIVGFIDDRYNLNPGGKLSLQIIPIFYLVALENLGLSQIGNYNYFEIKLGVFSLPFSILSVVFLMNAFNYFDGLDGMLGFATISTLSILLFLMHNDNVKLFLITILIPILIFLCFNLSIFKLPRLFLGDSGSLLLGFLIAFTLIYIAKQNIVHPILVAFSISIFVYEFISINLIRLLNKQEIFKAGRDHLHYILYKKNKSLFLTNILISFINIVFFIFGYLSFRFINPVASLFLFVFFFMIFFILRKKM
jgi:UDP-GlcNAc:undecaprenyl-phosphate GlcNAc-1-phosphate transferase